MIYKNIAKQHFGIKYLNFMPQICTKYVNKPLYNRQSAAPFVKTYCKPTVSCAFYDHNIPQSECFTLKKPDGFL